MAANSNLLHAWEGVLSNLVSLGRLAEARAVIPWAIESFHQFDIPACLPHLARLAAAERRWDAAARLCSCAKQGLGSRRVLDNDLDSILVLIKAETSRVLGARQAAALAEASAEMGDKQVLDAATGPEAADERTRASARATSPTSAGPGRRGGSVARSQLLRDRIAALLLITGVEGEMDAGAGSCGIGAGLIHDVPT